MQVSYYPGCALKSSAPNFEASAKAACGKLGMELCELSRWNCCGTVYGLSSDDLIHQLAPTRVLVRAKESARDSLITLCAMCYGTLKSVNLLIKNDEVKREKINRFMDEELDYLGEVEVFHLLEYLRDKVGYEKIKEKVTKPLQGLKIACYYGCVLSRPEDAAMDDVEHPTVMEKIIDSLGAEAIDFPLKTECCGTYQVVGLPELVNRLTRKIIQSAKKEGAELIAVSCPLCFFNLEKGQREILEGEREFLPLPIVYFTQLMALALGCDPSSCRFDLHRLDPRGILETKKVIG